MLPLSQQVAESAPTCRDADICGGPCCCMPVHCSCHGRRD
jgi:hypothetical protein